MQLSVAAVVLQQPLAAQRFGRCLLRWPLATQQPASLTSRPGCRHPLVALVLLEKAGWQEAPVTRDEHGAAQRTAARGIASPLRRE